MKKLFAVIGLGRFGSEVASTLSRNGSEVIAIDKDEVKVREVSDHVTLALQFDAIDEKALREAGVQNVDVAVVSIGENIEASILVVMLLKDIGIKNIVAKAVTELHGRILSQIGVTRVVYPERDMAQKIASSLVRADVFELIELSPEYSIVELEAPDFICDKTIHEENLRANYGITIIAIKRPEDEDMQKVTWNINPYPADMIKKGDTLVILGAIKDIEKFSSMK